MGVRRTPNHRLRALLAEAGWTGDALARAVNALSAEAHVNLRYQRSSVTHWLSGMRPREPVPELVAEALSRKLGRKITVTQTGFDGVAGDDQLATWWTTDPADELARLAETAKGNRRVVGTELVYRLAALSAPQWQQVMAGVRSKTTVVQKSGRIGPSEVRAAELMLPIFSDADSAHGGRAGHAALSAYLGRTISPWLHAAATSSTRRALLDVAAQLTYLCGFMVFDELRHGVSQRYYLTSLRLAAEAGNATVYALGLRALSVQARLLGHRWQAVDLAEAAVRTAAQAAPRQTCASLFGQLAVAYAAAGSRRQATANLVLAERHLDRACTDQPLLGAYHQASFSHQEAAVATCLGDRRGAIRALTKAIEHRPATERRSRLIMLARLAEVQVADGQIELACHAWTQFLTEYPHIRSARADSALANLRVLTRTYRNNPAVRKLERITARTR